MTTFDDWDRELQIVGSHDRGPVLLEALGELADDEARRLATDWWTSCEAWGDDLDDALEALGKLAPVGERLSGTDSHDPLTVYRATGGGSPDGGSWTLDPAVAERFAEQIRSGRGAFLGMHSQTPVVWTGGVDTADVLGYFTDRGEAEVVLAHGSVSNIERLGH